MYQNVVVLLDGSELAEGVLSHAMEVIRDRGSRVHLLSIGKKLDLPHERICEEPARQRYTPAHLSNQFLR